MNRILFSFLPAALVSAALAQTPGAPSAAPANMVTENGKVAHFAAGPGGRPQGFLLRNGTLVILPPSLSRRMPSTIPANASISVAGNEFTYQGSRTIQAQRVSVAGISYDDAPPVALTPPAPSVPPAPPAPGRGASPVSDPGPAARPVPAPCAAASTPPPPLPPNAAPVGPSSPVTPPSPVTPSSPVTPPSPVTPLPPPGASR